MGFFGSDKTLRLVLLGDALELVRKLFGVVRAILFCFVGLSWPLIMRR